MTETLNMVDTSSNNGVLDEAYFIALVAKGVKSIAIKAGEFIIPKLGKTRVLWEDPQFANTWQLAAKHGLLRIAYMYMHPDVDDNSQAQALGNLANKYGSNSTDRMMADVEVPGYTVPTLITLMQALDRSDGKPLGTSIFYSYLSYINDNLGGGVGLGDWPLFLADSGVTAPTCPRGWTSIAMWQFGQESIDGVTLDTDDTLNQQVTIATGEETMNAFDEVSRGTWVVDPSDGHVEGLYNAPYCGGLNEPQSNRYNWQQAGVITGITPWLDSNNEIGYAIIIRQAKALPNGGFYSTYTFHRNGQDITAA